MKQAIVLCTLLSLPLAAQEPAPPPSEEAPKPPPKFWTTSLGAGLAMTSGNTDTQNLNLSFNTAWDPKQKRTFKADALYLRGERDGELQVDKMTANLRFEHLFNDRAFWFGEVGYLRDPFRNVTYLLSPVAGAGYHVIRTETRKLTFDGAAGGAIEKGEIEGRDESIAVKAGESLEWALSPTSRLAQRLNGLWKTNDWSDALYHFETSIHAKVATRMELKVSWTYDYKNRPPSPEIEKGDSALFAALLFEF